MNILNDSQPATALAPTDRDLVAVQSAPSDRHPAAVYLARLGKGSLRAMRGSLNMIAGEITGGQCDAESLNWAAVRYQHGAAIRARLAERYKPATVNKHLSALRGVMREAWRLGLVSAEDYQRIADIEGAKGSTLPPGRALAAKERQRIYEVCAKDVNRVAGARDAALIAVLDGCGLRRSEAVALDLADFDIEAGTLRVRSGKGRKDRLVPVTNGAADALTDWLAVRGPDRGALFYATDKAGRLIARHIAAQTVYDVLLRRAEEANIASFSPHDFRRTLIGDLLNAGADLATVSALVGHSNVQTTARYDRRGDEAKRKAVSLRAIPYVKPKKKRKKG